MAEVWYLQQALEEEKDRNAAAFRWVQACQTTEIENISLRNQLEVVRITIDGLKRNNDSYGNEILRLQSKASLVEARTRAADTLLCHADSRAYETGFEDCKLLATQILLEAREPGARAREPIFLPIVIFCFLFVLSCNHF